ncbi:MAG TPA: hypothetical protein PKE06_04830 [Flavilitoribacter sp.]|nr:hypothetical protein [Flavilitoribacter sp.]HMQ87638.1 hypothetical protein [Flavilitoribacter sp.]
MLLSGFAFGGYSQSVTYCGAYVKSQQPDDGEFFDRFGNLYTYQELKIPDISSPPSGGRPVGEVCDCEGLGFDTGPFELFFMDCIEGSGIGFNDPNDGEARRIIACRVFQMLSQLIVEQQSDCQPGGVINVEFLRSDDIGLQFAGTFGSGLYFGPRGNIYNPLPWFGLAGGGLPGYSPDLFQARIGVLFDGTTFYTGTQPPPAGNTQMDFYTLVLHHAVHTIGFQSLLIAFSDRFSDFDRLLISQEAGGDEPVIISGTDPYFFDFNSSVSTLFGSCQDPNPLGPEMVFQGSQGNYPIFTGSMGVNGASFSHRSPIIKALRTMFCRFQLQAMLLEG